jgi:hypothetical protein
MAEVGKTKTLPYNLNQPNLHIRLLFRALALLKFSVFLQTAILIKKKDPKSIGIPYLPIAIEKVTSFTNLTLN